MAAGDGQRWRLAESQYRNRYLSRPELITQERNVVCWERVSCPRFDAPGADGGYHFARKLTGY
jgi:hypothetical protein